MFRIFYVLTVVICFVFWRKDIGAKAATKLLAKLTQDVNFTIILQVAFCTKVFCAAFHYLQFGSVIIV